MAKQDLQFWIQLLILIERLFILLINFKRGIIR